MFKYDVSFIKVGYIMVADNDVNVFSLPRYMELIRNKTNDIIKIIVDGDTFIYLFRTIAIPGTPPLTRLLGYCKILKHNADINKHIIRIRYFIFSPKKELVI